jgi:two-component system alkaline phosphatase synthesis response regulator PhoP
MMSLMYSSFWEIIEREVFNVSTARKGVEAIKSEWKQASFSLLDLMMPGIDGMETCQELRKIASAHEMLIVFLTARGEDYSQIAGFEAGADDYVTKPIKPKVLISRIKALLRRLQTPESGRILHFDNLIIDREKYMVISKGEEIILPRKEFELLSLLASKPERVFTREEIFEQVWGNDVIVGEITIVVHLRKIREKLGLLLLQP